MCSGDVDGLMMEVRHILVSLMVPWHRVPDGADVESRSTVQSKSGQQWVCTLYS